jgi:MSHA pilin protein MshC
MRSFQSPVSGVTAAVPDQDGRLDGGSDHAFMRADVRIAIARKAISARDRGFSLIELVVVLLAVGVLAVIAIPRFAGNQEFQTLGFFDSAQAAVRYAQKLAIAQRRPVHVSSSANSLRLCYDAGCTLIATNPLNGQPFVLNTPAGVSLAGASISFDGLGRPSAGATFAVTDSESTRSFVVEPESGYVYR